jgi:hypothetical protein
MRAQVHARLPKGATPGEVRGVFATGRSRTRRTEERAAAASDGAHEAKADVARAQVRTKSGLTDVSP